jgi:hypothetical protein
LIVPFLAQDECLDQPNRGGGDVIGVEIHQGEIVDREGAPKWVSDFAEKR